MGAKLLDPQDRAVHTRFGTAVYTSTPLEEAAGYLARALGMRVPALKVEDLGRVDWGVKFRATSADTPHHSVEYHRRTSASDVGDLDSLADVEDLYGMDGKGEYAELNAPGFKLLLHTLPPGTVDLAIEANSWGERFEHRKRDEHTPGARAVNQAASTLGALLAPCGQVEARFHLLKDGVTFDVAYKNGVDRFLYIAKRDVLRL
jgi:hypothetical protein